ncbi:50S ribosomal protein L23 [Planctomycetes bacterium Pla163]|uniref:Large ribosomal subunit protein uL23 n=1 Tax=Rohdeia mirabilis TaxID=2528008 RepID=A0A518D2T4_9BACT|nr:50S ribosomal protein L23 [Planctomycetes bacterium Pla163]
MSTLDNAYRVIRKPHVTEKSSDDMVKRNAYHFRVPTGANKVEIRKSVEALFGVKVLSVNTLSGTTKSRRRGYVAGRTQAWKKAMVTLREGDSIEVL